MRATGRRGSHHVNFELSLPDGRILYTRIGHPADRTDDGPGIFAHLLRDQLQVDAAEFWACVEDRVLPDRGRPQQVEAAIPLGVVRTLIHEAHLPEAEVRSMTKAEAVARVAEFSTTGR